MSELKSVFSNYFGRIFGLKERVSARFDSLYLEIPYGTSSLNEYSTGETVVSVQSECRADTNLMLNLSSLVAFIELEAGKLARNHFRRNSSDPDMYLHPRGTELRCVKWPRNLWNGPKDATPHRSASFGGNEAFMQNEMGRG